MFTFTAQSTDDTLAPGYYVAEVRDAIEGTSKKSGAPMIRLQLSVFGETKTEEVRAYLVSSPNALWRVQQFLYAIGRDIKPGDVIALDENDLIGRRLIVETTLRDGDKQGVQFPEIERFMRESDVHFMGPKPVSNVPQNTRRPATPKGRLPGPEVGDDDIPF